MSTKTQDAELTAVGPQFDDERTALLRAVHRGGIGELRRGQGLRHAPAADRNTNNKANKRDMPASVSILARMPRCVRRPSGLTLIPDDEYALERPTRRQHQATVAVARRRGVLHAVAGHDHLNTAVPAIAEAMDVTPLNVKSVLASYTLSLAVFIPVSGWMADRFGTRRIFAAAIGLFCLGSLLCGLSTSLEMLVACRVIQGAGGAMMMPVGRMTLARTFGKADLVRAMSFVVDPGVDRADDRASGRRRNCALAALERGVLRKHPGRARGPLLHRRYLPDYREDKTIRSTCSASSCSAAGIALLSYVLEVFGDNSLSRGEILGLLAVSALLLAGYGIGPR